MNGFIKLQREIQGTWIHKDPVLFKAWCDILFNVNWEEKQVFIGTRKYTCGVGESLYSLDTWASIFGGDWNKSKVRRFFKRLADATIIDTQNERKTTRLKVVNMGVSADDRHANATQTDTKMQRKPTPTKELRIKNKEVIDSNLSKTLKTLADEYLIMRAKIGKKLKTSRAIKTKLNRLEKYVKEFGEPKTIECLNLTLDNEWQDIKMEWLDREKKQKGSKIDTQQHPTLLAYLQEHEDQKMLAHWIKNKEFEKFQALYDENKFRIANIAKGYTNPNLNSYFFFRCMFMPFGKACLSGSSPDRKLDSLQVLIKKQNDYTQKHGDLTEVLKKNAKTKTL